MSRKLQRILFLCTGNCIRSQMAEGWLRYLAKDRAEAMSAGVRPAGFVHRYAIQVMSESGIDISTAHSKSVSNFLPPEGSAPDLVFNLCDKAAAQCPVFPESVKRVHWPVSDPYYDLGSTEERLQKFREVRDSIRDLIEKRLLDEILIADLS